jgi:hypothetical protein
MICRTAGPLASCGGSRGSAEALGRDTSASGGMAGILAIWNDFDAEVPSLRGWMTPSYTIALNGASIS